MKKPKYKKADIEFADQIYKRVKAHELYVEDTVLHLLREGPATPVAMRIMQTVAKFMQARKRLERLKQEYPLQVDEIAKCLFILGDNNDR